MLDSDPALRWQVERDIAGEPESVWRATRSRVATEGFGARLLALQDADGQWAGGAYFPGDFDFEGPEAADDAGQPWTATTWSLNALREWGVEASVLGDTAHRLERNSRWEYENLPYWDGGDCEWVNGSTRSSFHSTLNSLKGILVFEQATGGTPELRRARTAAQEYLLSRRLLFRASTGEHVGWWVDKFAYPFRWFYSALNALNYFREASLHNGAAPDARMADAVELIRAVRTDDGRWLQARRHPGRVWFEVDADAGEPSKWLTFYATRVLDWWGAK